MEQWIVDGRDLIRKRHDALSQVTPATLERADEVVLASSFCSGSDSSTSSGNWNDISGVKGLYKRILHEGGGGDDKPKIYAEATVKYAYYNRDGVLIDTHGDYGAMDFVCGGGAVTQALEEGVLSMVAGEVAAFVLDPAFGFRDEGLVTKAGRIGVDETALLIVELVEFENPMTDLQKCDRAEVLKQRGNEFLKKDDLSEAIAQYTKALYKLGRHGYKGSDDDVRRRNTEVRVPILSNLQLCSLKKKDYKKVLEIGENILKLDPAHGKAMFRRAQAFEARIEFDAAEGELRKMLEMGADVDVATEALSRLEQRKKENEAAQKASCSKMFK
eukprot:PhM_4_TR3755/c0_g1_i1/m.62711